MCAEAEESVPSWLEVEDAWLAQEDARLEQADLWLELEATADRVAGEPAPHCGPALLDEQQPGKPAAAATWSSVAELQVRMQAYLQLQAFALCCPRART